MSACKHGVWTCGLLLLGIAGNTQEWTRFRGPNGSGLGQAHALPSQWAPDAAVWKTQLPGPGHGSPVLWGERVFVNCATASGQRFTVAALDAADGKLVWSQDFAGGGFNLHRNNTFASSTPTVDAQRLYVALQHDGTIRLAALSHAGEPVWEYAVGACEFQHGMGHSPILHEGLVIYSNDQIGPGRIVALEAATGALRWEAPRQPGRGDYSTPCVVTGAGRDWLIFNTCEDRVAALDAHTGRIIWQSGEVLDKRSVSSPVMADGLLISSCGSGGGGNYVVALEPPTAAGGRPSEVWRIRRSAPYVPTPLALDDLLFLWADVGVVTCVEARTGEVIWRERVGGNFFSSPVCADGKLFGVSTEGELVTLAAAREYALLGRTPLGEISHATPAIAHGRLYVRTLTQLFCFGPVPAGE